MVRSRRICLYRKLTNDLVHCVELSIFCHFRHVFFFIIVRVVLPIFDYADLVWGDKNDATIMNDLQIMQIKAAKRILDRPLCSSATDVRLNSPKWLNLGTSLLVRLQMPEWSLMQLHRVSNTRRRSWLQHQKQGQDSSPTSNEQLGKTEAILPCC